MFGKKNFFVLTFLGGENYDLGQGKKKRMKSKSPS